jgi:hypothetical protein
MDQEPVLHFWAPPTSSADFPSFNSHRTQRSPNHYKLTPNHSCLPTDDIILREITRQTTHYIASTTPYLTIEEHKSWALGNRSWGGVLNFIWWIPIFMGPQYAAWNFPKI